ncbi:DUF3127 domain-containing protein [Fulvivirga sp.]|jgi:hypothetical protein|uniref:DUF3127 domain-containing protein n=1 Tax=Fulvivirga sp. TaxID=1931237 RepID=UPI0032EB8405
MNIKGKLLEVSDTQQISDSFKKREFVIEYAENPQYPEFVKFEAIQDKCALLDTFKSGDEIDVYFNIKGRKWNDPKGGVKYFNSLQAWKIDGVNASTGSAGAPPASPDMPTEEPGWVSENEDDLPF